MAGWWWALAGRILSYLPVRPDPASVMLGSTADYVVHHVHCDVMICKKPRKKE